MAQTDYMGMLLPYLIRRKFEKQRLADYLQNQLKGYEAWGGVQQTIQERSAENAIKLQLIKTGAIGVEDLDRPLIELLQRLGAAGITSPAIPTVSPEQLAEAQAPYAEMMPTLTGRMEAVEYPSEQEIETATRLKGSKWVNEWLQGLEKKKLGIEQRAVQRESLDVEKGKTKLGYAEITEKEAQRKYLKEGKVPKKEKELKELIKKRDSALDKSRSLTYIKGQEEFAAEAEKLTKQINAFLSEMGKRNDDEYRGLAESLKAKNYTMEDINKNTALVQDLRQNGYEIWILAGYM